MSTEQGSQAVKQGGLRLLKLEFVFGNLWFVAFFSRIRKGAGSVAWALGFSGFSMITSLEK